tara:strand:- start:402 stop:1271 length:870 start_codon:yes stop_codon:yes gene_type:complete
MIKQTVQFKVILKNTIIICFAVLLLIGGSEAKSKYASIIIDLDSGKVLHTVNATTKNYPASLTKMMTVYLIFEQVQNSILSTNSLITISARASRQPRSKLWLEPNSKITLDKAILALIIRSANDVAVAIAEHISGSEKAFARLMTEKAQELGMKNTTFKNASGLPNRAQLSTAEDLALLASQLTKEFPSLYKYFSKTDFKLNGNIYRGHNKFLQKYPGADGLKTGYIRASGYNLAGSAVNHNIRLVGVVLGSKSAKERDRHLSSLMTKAFASVIEKQLPPHPNYKPQLY